MKYKSQHFVPKCYLRHFSVNTEKTLIAGFNIKRNLFIPQASIKNQCARDYFYDRSGAIDLEFSSIEGQYSEVTKRILIRGRANSEELSFLRKFSYLQYLRTEAMAKMHTSSMHAMADFVFQSDPEGKAWASFDPKTVPREIIGQYNKTAPFLFGLRDCIIFNDTKYPFITSDNPSVVVNRFHIQKQRQKYGGSGLLNSGWMIVMPINPKITYVAFDPGIYQARLSHDGVALIRRPQDIEALNALQVIKSDGNIYFNNILYSQYVEQICAKFRPRTPEQWYIWNYATEDEHRSSNGHKRYTVVKSPEEFSKRSGLVHLQAISVNPGVWCSIFPFRTKPKFYDTGSGAGLVRSRELFLLDNVLWKQSGPFTIPRGHQSPGGPISS